MRSGANWRLGLRSAARTARRLADLLEHQRGVELTTSSSTRWPRRAEQLEHALVLELDADLGDEPLPAALERDQARLGEDLDGGESAFEHR